MLGVTENAGRGRGLAAAAELKAGQLVLREAPILLYLEAQAARSARFCHNCARCISSERGPPIRSDCGCGARFCSSDCKDAASRGWAHSAWACRALHLLPQFGLEHEAETQARFLVAALGLESASLQQLLLLEGGSNDEKDAKVAALVLSMSPPLAGASMELLTGLLAKDERNAFGLMAPTRPREERSVRAYAIYARASLFNHDCLPNACRFEYLDRPGDGNTDIHIRLLHDVKQGTEICLSYFPVNWTLEERRKRLSEDYGFFCSCERCKVEEAWSDNDEAMEEDDEEGDDQELVEDEQSDFPHAMFFVKYLCPSEGCGGTMAPLQDDASTMECNACSLLRSEAEFVKDLEEHGV